MDISVSWLRSLAPTIVESAEDLARHLSLQAVAVDRVEAIGEGLEDVVVARVLRADKHPNADRLTVCQVDAGGESLEVVCGAPNVVEGALYPFIAPGGSLPGGFLIEQREIRGVVSNGMLCSEVELGIGRDSAGILRLDDGYEPGAPIAPVLGLPDTRLLLDLTPNRVDLACHVGVARELAPGGVADIALHSVGAAWEPVWTNGPDTASAAGVKVQIEDDSRCYRYLAGVVRGVRVGPSPDWLKARLRVAGARPINNIVDATNYVLLELNQPLHAFDLERLDGPEIRVRAAKLGETLTTLDGTHHDLKPTATVIADASKPIALAGVMGGANAEVSDATSDVLVECAWFDPGHTRSTSSAAGLSTDASYRFERGIDGRGM
ncbi:MAG: phenylalanine--tRNA ligase subunit beta, partial [Gemmatimonadales bacterium]